MHQTTATTSMFRSLLLLSLGLSAAVAWAQQDAVPEFKALRGSYMMYSVGLGDPQPAKLNDSKIAFAIDGEAARKMFESMAPDMRDACTSGSSVRVRTKGHVSCQHEKSGEYRCSFGFDLRTGKSISGSVC
jgi:hypothetical protein